MDWFATGVCPRVRSGRHKLFVPSSDALERTWFENGRTLIALGQENIGRVRVQEGPDGLELIVDEKLWSNVRRLVFFPSSSTQMD